MALRMVPKAKEKLLFIILFLIVAITILYFYFSFVQDNLRSAQLAEKRCYLELTSIKYQLNVVTDYKNRIDKMLTESQKAHNDDKEKFKDIMENCITMKQQSAICQNQFEDLQVECTKVREIYNNENKEYLKLQDQYTIMKKENEKLNYDIKDITQQTNRLSYEIIELKKEIQSGKSQPSDTAERSYSNKRFSQQIQEQDGDYKIDIQEANNGLAKVINGQRENFNLKN